MNNWRSKTVKSTEEYYLVSEFDASNIIGESLATGEATNVRESFVSGVVERQDEPEGMFIDGLTGIQAEFSSSIIESSPGIKTFEGTFERGSQLNIGEVVQVVEETAPVVETQFVFNVDEVVDKVETELVVEQEQVELKFEGLQGQVQNTLTGSTGRISTVTEGIKIDG